MVSDGLPLRLRDILSCTVRFKHHSVIRRNMISVGVNGLGRIGRSAVHQVAESTDIELEAVNDLMDREDAEYLLNYDTVHERQNQVTKTNNGLEIGDKTVTYSQNRDPESLDWNDLDLVFECTGQFRSSDGCSKIPGKKVVISAPPRDGATDQYVYGVNHTNYSGERVVSGASCTTNSAAPPLEVLDNLFGIESAEMATVHAYTRSQNLVGGSNTKTRRGRAAAENIVPTGTGASEAVTEVLPELENSFDATAYRVPVPDGSITHITASLGEDVASDQLKTVLEDEASRRPELDATRNSLVSSDIIGTEAASILDLEKCSTDSGLARLAAWYDNETGYTAQMLRLGRHIAR